MNKIDLLVYEKIPDSHNILRRKMLERMRPSLRNSSMMINISSIDVLHQITDIVTIFEIKL